MSAAISSRSRTGVAEDRAHRCDDGPPLTLLRFRLSSSLGGQGVVLPRAAVVAVAPRGLEQARALHLVEGRVERAFFQMKRPRTPSLGLAQHLVRVHRTLGKQAEQQYADRAGQELAVVFRWHTLANKVSCLGQQD